MTAGSSLVVGGYSVDWMVVVLVLVLMAVIYEFYRAQRDESFASFNLYDLIMEGGKLSRSGVVMMGAFALTSWMMINLTLNNKMTEGYLLAYGGMWVAPGLTRIVKGPVPPPEKPGIPPKPAVVDG